MPQAVMIKNEQENQDVRYNASYSSLVHFRYCQAREQERPIWPKIKLDDMLTMTLKLKLRVILIYWSRNLQICVLIYLLNAGYLSLNLSFWSVSSTIPSGSSKSEETTWCWKRYET